MSGKFLSAVRAEARQMLRDEFVSGTDFEWEDDELDTHIGHCLREISKASPYIVKEILTTIENSRELDISSIEDLIRIERLEYPTGSYHRSYRNLIWVDQDTIEIDTTLIPDAGGSDTLTGTVTFISGSAAITGSGTAFSTELEVGYHIKKSTGTRWYRIYSIESDTALTLAEASRDSGADTEAQYCYETVYVYCAKFHSLTESSSTLRIFEEALLVDGVCAYAAIAKAREHINKIDIGGGKVAAGFLVWGQNKLALYKVGLEGLQKPRGRREYPKG